jgi:hypothetical protein
MMTVLLLFEGTEVLSFQEILFCTNIPQLHLRDTLHSLCKSPNKKVLPILVKSPATPEIDPTTDTFHLHPLFPGPSAPAKLSIRTIQRKK